MRRMGYKQKITAIYFTFFKYMEVFLNGVLILLLADSIGPNEMGRSVPSLLYITYSMYLSLGLNSVILKNFKGQKKENENRFLTVNFQLLTVLSLPNFLITYFLFSSEIFLLVSIISIGNLFRGFFTAYFRVVEKTYVLNFNNILLSVLLILFTFIFVNSWSDYLLVWSIITLITLFAFVVFDIKYFSRIFKNFFKYPSELIVKDSIGEGIKLSAVAGVSTVYLSIDRLIVNNMDLSNSLKGTYQFSDNLSMAVFIGASALIFFYTPTWIDKVKKDKLFGIEMLKIVNKSLIAIPLISLIAFFGSFILEKYWFSEYDSLSMFVVVITALKLLILLIGIQALIFIALNMEVEYLKVNLFSFTLILITFVYFVVFDQTQKGVLMVPSIIFLIMLILLVTQRYTLKKILKT